MFFVVDFLYTLIILPIETVIGYIYCFIRVFFSNCGVMIAIAGLSLAVSFIVLPLYNIADRQKLKGRDIQRKLAYRASMIKRAFRGDERFMILSEYYRLNHYHPVYALRGTVPTMIQIPFFIAAYHFLSSCKGLDSTFGPIKSLQEPDALVLLGCFRLNILPLLMTGINVISGIIYTRDAPLHEKVQVHALSVVFLLLLYNSPSGLVLYWMLNNVFSLCKNTIKKYCRKPWVAEEVFICVICALIVIYAEFIRPRYQVTRLAIRILLPLLCTAIISLLPMAKILLPRMRGRMFPSEIKADSSSLRIFLLSCLSASLLLGLFLPASMISSSPSEFVASGNLESPLFYLWSSLVFALGLCLLWPFCIYTMADKRHRPFLPITMITVSFALILNALAFRHNLGNVFVTGEVENWSALKKNGPSLNILPIFLYVFVFVVSFVLLRKNKQALLQRFMVATCLSLCFYSVSKIRSISSGYAIYVKAKESISETEDDINQPLNAEFHLSKNGKNVFTIFLDRSVGVFIPYMMKEFPQLLEQYRGFTLYPNTVSFSTSTFAGSPPLYGGYEYTQQNINRRPDELLNKKINEAKHVLPKIFSDAGWAVTITDSPYVNYAAGFGDFVDEEFREEYPSVRQIFTQGKFASRYQLHQKEHDEGSDVTDNIVRDGIIQLCILQSLYPPLRFFCI